MLYGSAVGAASTGNGRTRAEAAIPTRATDGNFILLPLLGMMSEGGESSQRLRLDVLGFAKVAVRGREPRGGAERSEWVESRPKGKKSV